MTLEERIACARVVAAVILADARISDAEHDFLDNVFKQLDLGPDERRQATAKLDVGTSVAEVAKALASDAARIEAIQMAARAMHADGAVVKTERKVVDELAAALGLGAEVAAEAIRLATAPKA